VPIRGPTAAAGVAATTIDRVALMASWIGLAAVCYKSFWRVEMRVLPLIVLTFLAAPAAAQAAPYDNYPVCIQVYFPSNTIECSYTSFEQCRATASGRSAQCMVNPFFVSSAPPRRGARHRAY
jgi:hypothetical protein